MPHVTIEWLSGRSPAQKAEIAAAVTATISEVAGVEPAGISVRFVDTAPGDWAIGGQLQDRP
jgi:phenylpyruvate tautomerase PptA (4-oxalocrotonate tautomerase family)